MWANFGPAIQVKHISLETKHVQPIVGGLSADQVVIVCKDADKEPIHAVLTAVGLGGRVRGIVTKADLTRWYDLALGPKHAGAMAKPLFAALLAEFDDEFTLADPTSIDDLTKERGYDTLPLVGLWSVAEPVVRAKKAKEAGPVQKTEKSPTRAKRPVKE
jgi:type II restriction enzyme